jgi:hypothetical protein
MDRQQQQQEERRILLNILNTRFSEIELRELCFTLDVDYEKLEGGSKNGKALHLLQHLTRRNRVPELIQIIESHSPDIFEAEPGLEAVLARNLEQAGGLYQKHSTGGRATLQGAEKRGCSFSAQVNVALAILCLIFVLGVSSVFPGALAVFQYPPDRVGMSTNTPESTRTPVVLRPQDCELGNGSAGESSDVAIPVGIIRSFSHCPPWSRVEYVRVSVDDELDGVQVACRTSAQDVTESFSRLDSPGYILPTYTSRPFDVPSGCTVEFAIREISGSNIGITVVSRPAD